ncbi:MAG TPA: matrixin family metalloprotease [Methanosarcina sp.]|nr:matrixin family metalloprotease [Methanosarcina sp.]
MVTNNKLYSKSLGVNGAVATTPPVRSGDSMVSCTVDFNSDKPWSTSGEPNKIDVQSAATHEFGHWLWLGHRPILWQQGTRLYIVAT